MKVGQMVRLGDVPRGATVAYDYREGYVDVVTVDGPSKPGCTQVRFPEPRHVPIEGTFGILDHWANSSEVRIISLP